MIRQSPQAAPLAETAVDSGSKLQEPRKRGCKALEVGRRDTDPDAPPSFQPEVRGKDPAQFPDTRVMDDNLRSRCENRDRSFSAKAAERSMEVAAQRVEENLPKADPPE